MSNPEQGSLETGAAVALVTGATGGIGKEIVASLLTHGWNVALNDLSINEENQQWLDKLNTGQTQAQFFSADIGDSDAVSQLHKEVRTAFGRSASLLVNNAAIQTWQPLIEVDPADWERILRTNLSGCFFNTQCFARHCINDKHGGSIVNIGSGCNRQAFPNLVAYAASKGGIDTLTKSSALELGQHGIRVNCIAPGAIETERTQLETANFASSWSALTPAGRIGTPSDVANAVLLLAESKAGFISGQTINVDGGLFSQAIWPEKY